MANETWVVQHGNAIVVRGSRRKGWPVLRYAQAMYDLLVVGPHHRSASTQHAMRCAEGLPSDLPLLDAHRGLLDGDLVVFSFHDLGSVLAVLWWIDAMAERGADVSRVRLATAPSPAVAPHGQRFASEAIALGDDVPALRALRQAIAADDDVIALPFEPVSEPRRAWAGVSAQLARLLPDGRGLDAFDALLLEGAEDDWMPVVELIVRALRPQTPLTTIGDLILWSRIEEMADERPRDDVPRSGTTALFELDRGSADGFRTARVRLTTLGREVRAGRDALRLRRFDRWVGGRYLTASRIERAGLRREPA
jgi:hypothetical protein